MISGTKARSNSSPYPNPSRLGYSVTSSPVPPSTRANRTMLEVIVGALLGIAEGISEGDGEGTSEGWGDKVGD